MISTLRTLKSSENHYYDNVGDEILDYRISSGDFWEENEETGVIRFKNCVDACSMDMLAEKIDIFKPLLSDNLAKRPLFASKTDTIKEIVETKEKKAVLGGPCLFGENEVSVKFVMKDGSESFYDYSTGKSYQKEYEYCATSNDMADFVKENRDKVVSILFTDYKEKLTVDEYEAMRFVFAVAKEINAMAVIPLPDMSYCKFLDSILEMIESDIDKNEVKENYYVISDKIADIYINAAKTISEEYPDVDFFIFNRRQYDMCEKFYENRSSFIEKNRVLKSITGSEAKREAVKDYISMPALPYHLFGIQNILEVDSLDEMESFRKCRKAHKGTINIGAIFYPEKLSADGKNTLFHTTKEYKEYINI